MSIPNVPQEAKSAEEAVVVAVLKHGWPCYDIARELESTDFGVPRNQKLWYCIQSIAHREPDNLDSILAMADELTTQGWLEHVGGVAGLSKLDRIATRRGHLGRHVELVTRYSARRQLRAWHLESAEDLETEAEVTGAEGFAEFMASQKASFAALATLGTADAPLRTSADVVQELARNQHDSVQGVGNQVKLGFPGLDSLVCARTKQLMLLAGRPSHGKSSLMMAMVREMQFQRTRGPWSFEARRDPTPVIIAPAEMPACDLAGRLVADLATVDTRVVAAPRRGHMDSYGDQMAQARKLIAECPLTWVPDNDAPSYEKTASAFRRWRAKNPGPRAVGMIDYLQMQSVKRPGGGTWFSEDHKNSELCRFYKILSVELDMLIVLISATNRNVDKRDDKWPMMSDLRHVGGGDFHANQIVFAHRPARYGAQGFKPGEWPKDVGGFEDAEARLEGCERSIRCGQATEAERRTSETLGPLMRQAWLPVVKARGGKIGAVSVQWDAPYTRFSEAA